ncbi:MAG TPA: type I methionyl aminopeptidase [Bacteroidales bacterium]|nr:type I methionyl aminopeptidase [Bacteroidales bacterium]
MINIRTEEEIFLLKQSSLLVGKTLAEVAKILKPGVTTAYLDKVAEEYIYDNGAIPGFKGYNGYPATLCISVNEQVVHGIPGNYVIKEGDIVSIDCGVKMNGYYGDCAYTFAIEPVRKELKNLLYHTKQALYKGIDMAIEGNRIGDIGHAVQSYVERYGYSVVRDLVGHGIGTNLHEEPQVPNFGFAGKGEKLRERMVLCIEPMINLGSQKVVQGKDGWTVITADKKPSAHFEHQIVIRKNKAEIISTFKFVEEIINLQSEILS